MSFHSSTLQSGESHELEPLNVGISENSSTGIESGYCSHMSRVDFSPRREPLANLGGRSPYSMARSAMLHKTHPAPLAMSNGFPPTMTPPLPNHRATLPFSRPISPLVSTRVVLEGSHFVTRVCHSPAKGNMIEPEEAIIPNRSSHVEDVWLPR